MRKLFTSLLLLLALVALVTPQTLFSNGAKLGGQGVVRRSGGAPSNTCDPVTSVLDDFNRANENPLSGGGNWTNKIVSADSDMKVDTNKAQAVAYGSAWWSATSFNADQEAFVTDTSAAEACRVYTRLAAPGTAGADGYTLVAAAPGSALQLYRMDDTAFTAIGAAFTQTIVAGDSFKLVSIGSTHTICFKPAAGSWTELGTRTDGTYNASGYIGIYAASNFTVDDFGGGNR